LANPFSAFGAKPVFQCLLVPNERTASSNRTVGLFTGSLVAANGSLSGKVFMDGKTTAYTGVMQGDGSVWFKVGNSLSATLPLQNGEVIGKTLSMLWYEYGLDVMVNVPGDNMSGGLAKPKLTLVPPGLLNRSGKTGYFTLALPSKTQIPVKDTASYPQGTGYASMTLTGTGTLNLAGILADGTKITASSVLVMGAESPVFAQLTTPGASNTVKGGSFGGKLVFDLSPADSDVGGTDWNWFRPAVAEDPKKVATQPYTVGWPLGIKLDPVGSHYDSSVPTQTSLGLGSVDAVNGNALLVFAGGKLNPEITVANFNIYGNKVVRIPADSTGFKLSDVSKTGQFKGAFTPNWTSPAKAMPIFQGVLLQKGTNAGGWGFFMSNALNDLDPESGGVTLGAP
jgi:hypothetical protein